MVIPNNSCSVVCLFKVQVHTIKFDIPLTLSALSLHSFALPFLNNFTELRIIANHTVLRINSASWTLIAGLTYAHRILQWLISCLKPKAKVPIALLWQGWTSQKKRRLYRTPIFASLLPVQYVLPRSYCNTLDFSHICCDCFSNG